MSSILLTEGRRGRRHVVVAQGTAGSLELAAAEAGKRHKVVGGVLSMAGADGTIEILTGATSLTGQMEFARRGGLVFNGTPDDPEFESAEGQALNLTSTGGAVRGYVKIITE